MANIPEPTIWFEVGQFIEYFHWAESPTGIQRVQIEIFSEANERSLVPGRVRFCRLDRYTHHFVPVEFAELAQCFERPAPTGGCSAPFATRVTRFISRVRADLGVWHGTVRGCLSATARWLRRCKRNSAIDSRISCFAPGDVLICLGNAWEDVRYGEFIALARSACRIRFIVLIYDLIPVTHPSSVSPENAAMFRRWLDGMIENADLMLAISDYSRDAVLAYARERGGRLPQALVLPLGTGFRPPEAIVRTTAPAKLPRRYVLFVSTISSRKNHQLVVQAWRSLIATHGADKVPHLVFVGQIGWLVDDFMADLKASHYLDGKVIILADFSDAEVREAYERCLFTVYPSLAEGWGLPIAESFEHGKLCIASNRTAMPEVGGELADYIDPEDLAGATATIEKAIFDQEYRQQRERQIRAKYRPVSWADSFSALMEALDRLPATSGAATADEDLRLRNPIERRS